MADTAKNINFIPAHGGDIYSVPVQYDFSANINPLGMPEAARRALENCAEAAEHYPDPECRKLTRALAEHENVLPGQIVCGNGAADLIDRIARVSRPRSAVLPIPSFAEYERALCEVECEITYIPYPAAEGFRLTDGMLRAIADALAVGAYRPKSARVSMNAADEKPPIIFLCLPNNPTGILPDAAALSRIRALCREQHILLVLDACFLDFTDVNQHEYIGELSENEILLKAFTKIFAMPGLRLGYCVCGSAELAERLRLSGSCWSVSVPAQLCGAAALRECGDYLERTRGLIRQEREFLHDGLTELGMDVVPSEANFLLWRGQAGLREKLLARGISIRDCANFRGLEPGWYRTAVRTREENTALLEALKAVR